MRGDPDARALDEIVVTVARYADCPRSTHAHAAASNAKAALAESQKKG